MYSTLPTSSLVSKHPSHFAGFLLSSGKEFAHRICSKVLSGGTDVAKIKYNSGSVSSSTFSREALSVSTAAGLAALVEVGVVTEAASIRAVEVDLEAGMASAVGGGVKAASEHEVVAALKAGSRTKLLF